MTPRKARPSPSDVAPPVSGNTTKAVASKVQNPHPTTSLPTAKKASALKHDNNLPSLEQTSSHLVAVADRNANTSPLLRLPAELRNKIWRFGLSHQVVTLLKIDEWRGGSIMFKVRLNSAIHYWLSVVLTGVKETFAYHTAVPFAFHLLQDCRQIYCETMLTSYEHTIFSFDNWWLPSINLLLVQRNAITKIRPTLESLAEHACGLTVSPYRKKHFPSLRELYIRPACLLEIKQTVYQVVLRMVLKEGLQIDTPGSGGDWKTWLTQQLKSIEGEDLKVMFED